MRIDCTIVFLVQSIWITALRVYALEKEDHGRCFFFIANMVNKPDRLLYEFLSSFTVRGFLRLMGFVTTNNTSKT